jgi:hypothetical protein
MALWYVHSRQVTRLMLWRSAPHAFRVMEYDKPADLLTNSDYILFDRKYEGALRTCGGQLELTPVTVTDEVRKTVWHHYMEATIKHSASDDGIIRATPPSVAIYRYGENNVFVSDKLKAALQQVQGQALVFSLGLSSFAA